MKYLVGMLDPFHPSTTAIKLSLINYIYRNALKIIASDMVNKRYV